MDSDASSPALPSASFERPQLLRVLGLREITAVVMGGVIGSAIFIVPADITREAGSQHAALAVWAIAGLLSLFGALTYAELAVMLPQAGGQYVFLREAYGSLVGFLCGWTFFLATQSGANAALAVGFSQYLAGLVPISPWQQKAAAALAILLLTAVNYRGVQSAGWLQSLLTGLTVGAMVALVALSYVLVHGSPSGTSTVPGIGGKGLISSFGVAMVGALWAYEGWNAGTFAAAEVKHPERNLPLALIFGTAGVVALYLALNLAYYHVLSLPEIVASPRVAADTAVRVLGVSGSDLISVVIIISIFGCINSGTLTAARVYYAMAEDGLFFRWCASVHPRFRTPHISLVAQAVWTIVLVLLGRYEQIYTYVVFAAWVFYALTAFAVIVLRRRRPDLPRPYRVFGYPLVPIVFVLTAAWFVMNTLVERPLEAGVGSLIVAIGVPVYFIWRRS